MIREFSRRDRIVYAFDTMMSRGTAGLIIWLGVLSAILIVLFSVIITFTGTAPDGESFPTLLWMSLMRTMDPGTIGGDQGSSGFLLSMLLVTFSGIFIFSALIGILTTGLEAKLESLRKGRSRIVETGHTVVLGWSEQVFTIISELSIANENQKNPCIAIMSIKDKIEMEEEIRAKVPCTGKTRVVCRTGSPVEPSDIAKMSLHTSKSIIILAPDIENPDPEVIKTMLAITNRSTDSKSVHMVALISDPDNVQAARIVGGDQAEIVLAGDLIARMAAQTCLQSGLSVVYQELLDYGGDEIYFHKEPRLIGKTFSDALLMYETSTIIGLKADNGAVILNPPMNTVISTTDSIIAVSEDDDTIILSGRTDLKIQREAILHSTEDEQQPRRIIMFGWNWRAPIIIRELSNYLKPGSTLLLVADDSLCSPSMPENLKNLTVEFKSGRTTDRSVLEELSIQQYDHIIILSYSDSMNPQEADSCTLMTLLHMRDIADKLGQHFSLISEMRDIRNRNLAEITGADDYIVSDQVLSLLLTQISENKHLSQVFWNLFDPEGSEIYLKPVQRYVSTKQPVNFYTVSQSASELNEIALGYRINSKRNDSDASYGIAVNPNKNDSVIFAEDDMIIVLAED